MSIDAVPEIEHREVIKHVPEGRERAPEAKAEQAKHARIRTQVGHQSRTATCAKAGQSSRPRAARE